MTGRERGPPSPNIQNEFVLGLDGGFRFSEDGPSQHAIYQNPSATPSTVSVNVQEKYNVMVRYLYSRISANMWLSSGETRNDDYLSSCRGVLLRQSRGQYVSQPLDVHPDLLAAVRKINVEVAFTMCTDTTDVIFQSLKTGQTELILHDGSQYQIVEQLSDISRGASSQIRKFQYACLVKRERLILVWHDDIHKILVHAQDVEKKCLALIWGDSVPGMFARDPFATPTHGRSSFATTPAPSIYHASTYFGKKTATDVVEELSGSEVIDEEKAENNRESLARPLILTSAVFVGLAMTLLIVLSGLSLSQLLYEFTIDGSAMRFALVAALPFLALFGLFFVIVIFSDLFEALGPISGVRSNSRFHSAIAPNILQAEKAGFGRPHMTIQMPVYKESLSGVIKPTIASLKEAISHYELCGGTANIFVNDDGLQLLDEEEAQERINFYHDNNIGWVARPKHGEDGFVRAGKFKKASNMNYALNISNKVEEALSAAVAHMASDKGGYITSAEEELLYHQALDNVIAGDGRVRAAGNIRVGEIILIVDSDTRVPADCLLYGAAEMFLSPEVAIVQHSCGVMQVTHDYFENAITFFTNLVYTAIRFSIGAGEVAPFVGHNAFLRWAAIQSVAMKNPDGYEMYWSESHVSEDFDLALRLQIKNNVVRLASYHGDGFKEGVSLTIYDELARWEKYAYGCNEMVFNKIHTWPYKGLITKLFRSFCWSGMQLSSKITITGYIASYYAMASGLPLTLANYFLIGWFNGYLDTFYMESWHVFLGLLVVFGGLGNVCLAILRYRLGEMPFFRSLLENFRWQPMFAIFFSGMSFHLNQAILAHLFSINMEWGATAKELEASNFFKEVPKIFKTFKYMYIFCIICIGGMIYLGCFAPHGWEIKGFTAVVPLAFTIVAHVIVPVKFTQLYRSKTKLITYQFVMNPALMVFNY